MITFYRLPSFQRSTKKLFEEEDVERLIACLLIDPEQGDVIPGTKGLRKLRFALGNRGKRGGSRVIYYLHVPNDKILLLYAYAKNERSDMSAAEKKLLIAAVEIFLENE